MATVRKAHGEIFTISPYGLELIKEKICKYPNLGPPRVKVMDGPMAY
jgi:hypothetical protein